MSNFQFSKQMAKNSLKTSLLYAGLALALIVALPLLAGLAYAVRFLIPLLLVGAVIALAFSPTVRRWFGEQADDASEYKGILFPTASLQLHPSHSWVNLRIPEAGLARIGVDALALAALGKISAIEPPTVGTKVAQGDILFSLCRGERRLQVKAPVSGTVAAVHSEAVQNPTAFGSSPYGSDWIVGLADIHAGREATSLLGGKSARRWFQDEVDRLTRLLSPAGAAATMADGGRLSPDLAAQIDDGKWVEVTAQIFGNPRS
jgi:glycine cleavage system H protein